MPGGGGPWLRRSASAQSASLVGDGSPLFASRARRQLLSLAAAALQLARRRPGTHSQIARACRRRHALPNGMNRRRCRARHAEFRFRVGRRRRFNSPGGSPPGGMQQAGLYPNPAVASHSATCPAAAYPSLHLSESSPSTSQTQYSQCIWPKLNALPPSRDQQKLNTPFQWRILSHV